MSHDGLNAETVCDNVERREINITREFPFKHSITKLKFFETRRETLNFIFIFCNSAVASFNCVDFCIYHNILLKKCSLCYNHLLQQFNFTLYLVYSFLSPIKMRLNKEQRPIFIIRFFLFKCKLNHPSIFVIFNITIALCLTPLVAIKLLH